MNGRVENDERIQRGFLCALEQMLIPFAKVINCEWVSRALNELLSSIRTEIHRIDREKVLGRAADW